MPLDMSSPQATPVRLSAQEALVGAMVVMSACDGHMTDAELATMSRLVKELPVFSDFHVSGIETATEIVLNLLGDTDGLDEVVALIRDALPQRLRETAYLLACEIVAADGDATQDELRFLQDFRIGLDLSLIHI